MVANIAFDITKYTFEKSGPSRFTTRHKNILNNRYFYILNLTRYKANNRDNYEQYFNVINAKMKEYKINADNIYNINEKDFIINAY